MCFGASESAKEISGITSLTVIKFSSRLEDTEKTVEKTKDVFYPQRGGATRRQGNVGGQEEPPGEGLFQGGDDDLRVKGFERQNAEPFPRVCIRSKDDQKETPGEVGQNDQSDPESVLPKSVKGFFQPAFEGGGDDEGDQ